MKKYVVCFLLVISVVITCFLLFVLKPSPTIKLTTIKKAYSYVSCYQDEEKMQVNLLINDLDTAIINTEKYSSISISDKTHHDEIMIELEEIIYQEKVTTINEETFYQYSYHFTIPFKTEDKFFLEIEEAYLCMHYRNIDINLPIGSFSYYKVPYLGDDRDYISISKLKPIVNDCNEEKILVGVIMGISNQTKHTIIIKRIVALDLNLQFYSDDIIVLQEDVLSSSNISTLLGKNYTIHSNYYHDEGVLLIIPPNTTTNYLLPIKYHSNLKTNQVGFSIEYDILEEKNTLYYDEFLFFTTKDNHVPVLEILTYENK